jgi:hypothetical protein
VAVGGFASFSDVKFVGLDSVTRLLVDTYPPNENGIKVAATIGASANPIGLELTSQWVHPYENMDEEFDLTFSIEGALFTVVRAAEIRLQMGRCIFFICEIE